jgi:hypothetical protein
MLTGTHLLKYEQVKTTLNRDLANDVDDVLDISDIFLSLYYLPRYSSMILKWFASEGQHAKGAMLTNGARFRSSSSTASRYTHAVNTPPGPGGEGVSVLQGVRIDWSGRKNKIFKSCSLQH